MCDLDKAFILCTCADKDFKDKNFWEIYRYDKKLPQLMGITSPCLYHEHFKNTSDFLLHELNERNCFDKEIDLKDHDVLVINIRDGKNEGEMQRFAFEIVRGKWFKDDVDMMHLVSQHMEKEIGMVDG